MQLKYLTVAGLAQGVACALSKRTIECSFTTDASKGDTCDSFADVWGLSVEGLQQLNPGITCPDLDTTKSYCVIGTVSDNAPSTMSTTTISSTTTSKFSVPTPSTITTTTAAVPTNSPTMPGIVDNCDGFYYVCVHIPGTTTTTTAAPDPTNDPSSPTPQLPGIVENCRSFHLIKDGENCWSISNEAGITLSQLREWNTELNAACDNLWLGYYVCVGV